MLNNVNFDLQIWYYFCVLYLKPNNLSLAYLIVLKLNEYLIFNSTNQFIDLINIIYKVKHKKNIKITI